MSINRLDPQRRWAAHRSVIGIGAVLVLGGLAANANVATAVAAQRGGTLTVAMPSEQPSINPALASNGNLGVPFEELAYDSLIRLGVNGQYLPDLATKWKYVGKSNKKFVLTLRKGVKFADGESFTATAVVNSLKYIQSSDGQFAGSLAGDKIKASGPLSVTITSPTPNPNFPAILSEREMVGMIIAPKGLKNPKALGNQTFGAGEYVLDPSQTVANDHYTYVANPKYWDQKAIHYQQVVLRIITDPNAALEAVTTGQVNLAFGSPQTAAQADANASINVAGKPSELIGIWLLDRNGTQVKALASTKVRQALNYAIDRPLLTKAIYGSYGSPAYQADTPGFDAYVPSLTKAYPYDPAKARKLLKEAGYAKGFSFTDNVAADTPLNARLMQAVAGQLAHVGVTMTLHTNPSFSGWATDLTAKKYPAATLYFDGGPAAIQSQQMFQPDAGMNPFGVTVPALQKLYAKAQSAPTAAKQTAAWQQYFKVVSQQALMVPVSQFDQTYYYSKTLGGVQVGTAGAYIDVRDWYPLG